MPTTLRSYSKINLGLAIGPARADGFHPLTTLYQTLAAHDDVTVTARKAAQTRISLASDHARVPNDARNTAWKIVEKALAAIGIRAEIDIHIAKRLPVQGGLGAGSANAAAALLGLELELERELLQHGVPPLPQAEKLRIAAEVGSDVPLFLVGGAVLGVGRGEEVSPLPDLPQTQCVLALPEIGVSTPQAFREWDALSLTHLAPSDRLNELSRALASALYGPHSSGVSGSAGDRLENPLLALVRTGIENDFEQVVFRQYPSLGQIKRILVASGGDPEHAALYAALSGSGSALFGLYPTDAAAEAAEVRLAANGVRSLRTHTLPRDVYWRDMVVNDMVVNEEK